MKDQTAMERLLYLVRTVGVEFTIRPRPVSSGVLIQLSLPNGWRYSAQRAIPDHDIENANVPVDDVIRRAVDELERQLRRDGTDASHGREPQKAERGVSPIQFSPSLMKFATLDNPEPRSAEVIWDRINKALADWCRQSADWPRRGGL